MSTVIYVLLLLHATSALHIKWADKHLASANMPILEHLFTKPGEDAAGWGLEYARGRHTGRKRRPICTKTANSTSSDELLKVGVYYETLCPDSREFIRNAIYDTMILNDWIKYTDLDFVPYGKVSSWTDPSTNITTLFCQHGHSECEQNALHACIVEHIDVKEQVKLITCLFKSHTSTLDECASELVLDVSAVKECKSTRSTPDILKKYGEMTDALDISFVPSVTFDEKFDRWRQRYFIYNFAVVFCKEYRAKYNITLPHC